MVYLDTILEDNELLLKNMLKTDNKMEVRRLMKILARNCKTRTKNILVRDQLKEDMELGYKIVRQVVVDNSNYKVRYIATVILISLFTIFANCEFYKGVWIMFIMFMIGVALYLKKIADYVE